ncbi:MAG TPA: ankyrin repeat domain-containing protein [Tepidisphaeraceae bacterium]
MAKHDVETFCRALWKRDSKTVAALAARVDLNAADRWGNTPLLMAAQYADLALVALLVERGAAVDQNRKHLTPVTLAARRKAGDIVKFLRGQGATMSIITWIHLGDRDRVERELARDPKLARLRDEAGTPVLFHAAEALRPEMVALLLDRGANVNETDPNGETALHRVADIRQAPPEAGALAKLLLERGAEPNARNWDEVTPLHQAARARNLAVAEVLLAAGADPNARDKNRRSTPLRRAVSGTGAGGTKGTGALMAPLARLLLRYGANPDARDKRGVAVRASARAADVLAVLDQHRGAGAGGRTSHRNKGTVKANRRRG